MTSYRRLLIFGIRLFLNEIEEDSGLKLVFFLAEQGRVVECVFHFSLSKCNKPSTVKL